MKIGEPLRAYVVEPLEEPVTQERSEEDDEAEAVDVATERETAPTA